MKKEKREIYQVLANEIDFQICCFCSYYQADCQGSSPCDCGEPYCRHPLESRFSNNELGDCWGFRPAYDVSLCADITGIIKERGWGSALWWEDKQGQFRITKMQI